MIPGNRLVLTVPKQCYLVYPWTVNWLKEQSEFWIILQPCLCTFTFMNDVIIYYKRDGLRPPIGLSQTFQHLNEQAGAPGF